MRKLALAKFWLHGRKATNFVFEKRHSYLPVITHCHPVLRRDKIDESSYATKHGVDPNHATTRRDFDECDKTTANGHRYADTLPAKDLNRSASIRGFDMT